MNFMPPEKEESRGLFYAVCELVLTIVMYVVIFVPALIYYMLVQWWFVQLWNGLTKKKEAAK